MRSAPAAQLTSFDAGRGCPFQCSFCTIINVQGRKSRYRTADDVEAHHARQLAQGINRFFITDDNFARNKDWEPIFDRLIQLREEEGMTFGFMIQVDTLCHKIPNFIEKATRAGVTPRVHRAGEHQSGQSRSRAKKRQNKITEYREMLLAWKAHGVHHLCRLYPRLPGRHAGDRSVRDIEIIKRELPLDMLEFFFLTPLPGSEDHKRAAGARASGWTRTSTNTTSNHRVTAPSEDVGGGMGGAPIAPPGTPITPPST